MNDVSYYSPPEVAKLLRVAPEKVVNWIRRGELPAVNVATTMRGRPRYRISEADLQAFKHRRSVIPPPPKQSRRRRKVADVIEFF